MRRKDREQSETFGLGVIDESPFGTLTALDPSDPGLPYAIPLSLVRIDRQLFFHAAKAGTKTALLTNGVRVRIVFVGAARVPDLYSEAELDRAVRAGHAGQLVSQVFTTEYRSAIVCGTVRRIDAADPLHKDALRRICEKYTPDSMRFFEAAYASGGPSTDVYCIDIESITAKQKALDRP